MRKFKKKQKPNLPCVVAGSPIERIIFFLKPTSAHLDTTIASALFITMKFSLSTLLLLPAVVAAFAPQHRVTRSTLSLSAAKSFEEDLEKTRAVIASFIDGRNGPETTEIAEEEVPEAKEDEE